jgi:hypothetical protein
VSRDPFDVIRALRDEAILHDAKSVVKGSSLIPTLSMLGFSEKFRRACRSRIVLFEMILRSSTSASRRAALAARQLCGVESRQHYGSNAAGSTLRLTLGCLLADTLGLRLRRVGSKRRLTFGPEEEKRLSEWMAAKALVSWAEHRRPWDVEGRLIAELHPPLNVEANAAHSF